MSARQLHTCEYYAQENIASTQHSRPHTATKDVLVEKKSKCHSDETGVALSTDEQFDRNQTKIRLHLP